MGSFVSTEAPPSPTSPPSPAAPSPWAAQPQAAHPQGMALQATAPALMQAPVQAPVQAPWQAPMQAPWLPAAQLAVPPAPLSFQDDDPIAPAAGAAAASQAQPEPEVRAAGPLTIDARVEYRALPRGRAQDVFGIVTLQAAAAPPAAAGAADEPRQPMDLICVLDVSGSMSGEKLRLVQGAVRFVADESRPEDRLSLVAFNTSARRELRLRRMDGAGKNDANTAALRLKAGGGTSIASGLETALQVAEARRHRNPVSAILLLTDGRDSYGGSHARFGPLLARAQRAGCALYAFGFGRDHDSQLLSTIAEQAKTPFTFVEDVDGIGAAFAGAIGGIASVAAQRIEVTLQCNAELKQLHTHFESSVAGGRATVSIPDMLAGERRDVLVEMTVPAHAGADEEETLLLEASARYWDLAARGAAQTPAAQMRLRRTCEGEPQPEQEPDAEVTAQRHRVEVAQTLQAAASHGDAGRFGEAQQVLQAHEQRLRASPGGMTPISENLALELEDARNRMGSRSSWEAGGSAEVRDAMQMHSMQRTTNLNCSAATTTKKCSKAMYLTSAQSSWISKSKGR